MPNFNSVVLSLQKIKSKNLGQKQENRSNRGKLFGKRL